MPHVVSPLRLDPDRSAVLVIDVQEKLVPVIPSGDAVIKQTHRILDAAKLLSVPAAATVQYPKGLGPLTASLRRVLPNAEEKQDFSAAVCRRALDRWLDEGRDQIVITGVETHVCVQQTVLDLIAEGLRPYLAAEAVASRDGRDHETAMGRMRDAGATITTVESILFEWLGTADRPEFKSVSKLVKEWDHRPPHRHR
jgi:nicotinamidase-related amidase